MASKSNQAKYLKKNFNKDPYTQDHVVLEQCLADERGEEHWKTLFVLRQKVYGKFYGDKAYEAKYNKVELIRQCNGNNFSLNLSLDAFKWLIKNLERDWNIQGSAASDMDVHTSEFVDIAHYKEPNSERYYTLYPINEDMFQLIYSDGKRGFGINLSALARRGLVDLNKRIHHLIEWDSGVYKEKQALIDFAENLFIHLTNKNINTLVLSECDGCQNETIDSKHDCEVAFSNRPDKERLIQLALESVFGDFNNKMALFIHRMNIGKGEETETAFRSIQDLMRNINEASKRLETHNVSNSVDDDFYNFDGIFSVLQ